MMSWTMDDREDQDSTTSWNRNSKPPNITNTERNTSSSFVEHNSRDELMSSLCAFKPNMMEVLNVDDEWYMSNNTTIIHNHNHNHNHQDMMLNMRDMSFSPTNFGDPSDNNNNLLLHHHHHHPVDSSSSCSPSPSIFTNFAGVVAASDPSSSSQLQYFLPNPKATTTTMLLNNTNNPFDCEVGFLEPQGSTSSPVLQRVPSPSSSTLLGGFIDIPHDLVASKNQLITLPNMASSDHNSHSSAAATKSVSVVTQFPQNSTGGFAGFQNFDQGSGTGKSPLFLNRPKILRPLESLPPSGAQPTLFQKRAALRKNNMVSSEQGGVGVGVSKGKCEAVGEGSGDKKRRVMMMMMSSSGDEMEDASFDGSALNYDSDDLVESNNNNSSSSKVVVMDENNAKNNCGNSSNGNNSTVTGVDHKGKKKGMPAKNLMAERRRRKKLNDRLYMLRSVVPKISKMDRASILGDAIEYLKELLQRINDLHNELESTSGGSSLTPVSSFHPLTPTPPALPSRIKEEMCPSSLPSPNGQPARVEVRLREGRAVNIHMFCGRKPGLLLSTMRALDNLGLDIQQAVISCFNGFAMDIFRAEQCKEGQDVHPEQIKAVLLDTAGYPGMI